MSSTSGTPRATIPRSTRRGRRTSQLLPRHQTPRFAGAFLSIRGQYARAPDTVDRSAAVRSSASRERAMKNLLTDIAGVGVGHADDATLASGVTAVIFDKPAVTAIDVRGGGPGTREDAALDLANTVERVDAITLSGGSALGLDSAGGVQAWLAEQGRGFRIREAVIPIVPGAICFDLLNGGNKAWGRFPPYRDLGYTAAAAAGTDFALGSIGAGLGATTANFKGGLGSASAQTSGGVLVAALAVVNAVGSVTVGEGPWFWAAPFEVDREFGGRGLPPSFTAEMLKARLK